MNENLSIRLSTDVIYLNGTVNGVDATFTMVEVGLWTTTVPKSPEDKYVITITTYNSLGESTLYETTIYKLDTILPLKINWTKEDYYNTDDLSRVEVNTEFISSYLKTIGFSPDLEIINSNWNFESIPTLEDINIVESNIDELKNSFYLLNGWEERKTWIENMKFSYNDANRFEKNLKLIHYWMFKVEQSYKYCGEFNCGEDVI